MLSTISWGLKPYLKSGYAWETQAYRTDLLIEAYSL